MQFVDQRTWLAASGFAGQHTRHDLHAPAIPYQWFRARADTCHGFSPHPDMATQPHQHANYLQMMTDFGTAWIPLGDCARARPPASAIALSSLLARSLPPRELPWTRGIPANKPQAGCRRHLIAVRCSRLGNGRQVAAVRGFCTTHTNRTSFTSPQAACPSTPETGEKAPLCPPR